MGLASSVGLGIALARPELPVVVLDGDGSLLMNLGGLTTLARYRPSNLVHVVFDNESLLSVGGFPTATSTGSDLAAIAAGGGRAAHRDRADARRVPRRVLRAQAARRPHDARRQGGGGRARPAYVTDLSLLENRYQFAAPPQEGRRSRLDAPCPDAMILSNSSPS